MSAGTALWRIFKWSCIIGLVLFGLAMFAQW